MSELRRFLALVKTKVQEQIDNRTETLADGAVSSFEQFRRISGEIAGLRSALSDMDEAFRQMLEHDEDDP